MEGLLEPIPAGGTCWGFADFSCILILVVSTSCLDYCSFWGQGLAGPGWAWYRCQGKNRCPKERTACPEGVGDGMANRAPGRRVEPCQHLKPQPSSSSSVVRGGAELWEAASRQSVSLLVRCASPSRVHRVAPRDGRWLLPPTPRSASPAPLCPGSAPASGGTWMWHVRPSPAACGRARCFGDSAAGLEMMMFCCFPTRQDRLLVGRQGRAEPGCCNPGLRAVRPWHAWGSTLGPLILLWATSHRCEDVT